MRCHIDLVNQLLETAKIIPFGARRNPEQAPRNFSPVFSPSDRFSLIVTSATETPEGRQRGVRLKREGLSLVELLGFLKNHRVLTREPDEARYWESPVEINDLGQHVRYDLHIFIGDHEPLDLQQFWAINRMILNGYVPPVGWHDEKQVANDL